MASTVSSRQITTAGHVQCCRLGPTITATRSTSRHQHNSGTGRNNRIFLKHAHGQRALNNLTLNHAQNNASAIGIVKTEASVDGDHLKPFPARPAAVIFDLDGTLAETEMLKARSYAAVAASLCMCSAVEVDRYGIIDPKINAATLLDKLRGVDPHEFDHQQGGFHAAQGAGSIIDKNDEAAEELSESNRCADAAMAVFHHNIGATSKRVCEAIVEELDLADKLQGAKKRFGVSTEWEALYRLRKEIYYSRFATPEAVWSVRYPHNLALVHRAHAAGIPVALATSSSTPDAQRVLDILKVAPLMRSIKGADLVSNPKPDPEIYLATAQVLGVEPATCLVVEDSLNGLRAAVAAGMQVLAVANDFTAGQLQAQSYLAQDHIVYDVASQMESRLMYVAGKAAAKASY
eukprot:jgi/Mesvir1/5690/Mv15705-RA.1